MERKLKKQQRTIGSIVKIPLENGFHTYARVLEVKYAFYDCRTQNDLAVDEIVSKPILFFASVTDSAITKGFWEKVGKKLPLEDKVLNIPPTYTQDILNPNSFTIYENKTIRSATKDECFGLEVFAVWTYANVEQRLNDYYANRENEFVRYMLNASIAEYYRKPINSNEHSSPRIKTNF